MTRFPPPPDRVEFEKRIDEKFEAIRSSKRDFARFSKVDASLVSKRLSPDCDTHTSSFMQIIFDLAALRFVSPELALDIWKEVSLEVEKLFGAEKGNGNLEEMMNKFTDRYGDLVKALYQKKPIDDRISIFDAIEREASQIKEELIVIKNERFFNTDIDK